MRWEVAFILSIAVASGCSATASKEAREKEVEHAIAKNSLRREYFDEQLPDFLSSIEVTDSLQIYEGLPHNHFEKELLKRERATKSTVVMSRYDFYLPPLTPSESDQIELKAICATRDSFSPWAGDKLCGGFHPDWLLEWKNDMGETSRISVCFGCGEARFISAHAEVWTEINENVEKQLKAILDGYHKQRPPIR
jgi:hypothetical protein